ncbi:MAG: prolyl-tRNA synthetase associated domain-containing protein [Ruminococcaceae bacterium]|nr:prolyl-tRNA synthetase associated domain-containing protein [Oscillospiraceae bacterium]
MQREEGRPTVTEGRLEKELRVYDLLDVLHVAYSRIDHAPAMTMEICREIDESLDAVICKNLFLCNRQQTDFYLLMIPGEKVFKTKDLSGQIGSSRLSFASGEQMEALLDCSPGSASVLGLMNDLEGRVRLLIDREVLEGDYVGMHPCVNTASLRISTADLLEKLLPAMRHTPTLVTL